MGDHGMNPTCLSAEKHKSTRNPTLHYLGCLEFCKRAAYFDSLPSNEKSQIEASLRRTEYLRAKATEDDDVKILVTNLRASFDEWRKCSEYQEGIKEVVACSGRSKVYSNEEHCLL